MTETVLLVHFGIHPEHADAFDQAVRRNATASVRDEPGCRQFDVCRDGNDPTCFMLYERYDDDAAVEAHRRSPHYLAMQAEVEGWVASFELTTWERTE